MYKVIKAAFLAGISEAWSGPGVFGAFGVSVVIGLGVCALNGEL